jgi:hypothetical protein
MRIAQDGNIEMGRLESAGEVRRVVTGEHSGRARIRPWNNKMRLGLKTRTRRNLGAGLVKMHGAPCMILVFNPMY